MTINQRVKLVREELNMTQIEFGAKLGISQSHLTSIESAKRVVTEKTLKVICLTFNVNEDWLRSGTGDMFIEDDNFLLSSLSQQYGLDNLDRKIIETYMKLPDHQRSAIKGFVRGLVDNILTDENYEEYRADYIKENAAPIAARHGDTGGLSEAAALYDEVGENTTE